MLKYYKIYLTAIFTLAVLFTSACTPINVMDYHKNEPKFDLRAFFSGELMASGIVKNRKGKVTRYFDASMHGSWNGDTGTLHEQFTFSDGEKQTRVWTMKEDDFGNYIASANDVVGESTMKLSGNALFLNYTLDIPYKGRSINIKVDDRMYLVNKNTLINESVLYKFGFEVGYLTLVIIKR